MSFGVVFPLYFVNSRRPCFLSSRLCSLFAFSVVLSVVLSYVSAVQLSFAVIFPLYFVNSLRSCFLYTRYCSLFAFSVILSLYYVSPFYSLFCQSFFLFLTSLLYVCLSMSYSHCISSILSDSVCFFCGSFSFLRQFFPFFAFSVVLFLAYVTCLYLSLDVVFSLHFVNSHRLCLLFLSFFVFPTSVLSLLCLSLSFFLLLVFSILCFVCRSFSFQRHFTAFVSRCRIPTAFRQFSQTFFAFSVVLLSFLRQLFPYFVFLCRCFPFLGHCCVFVCR